MSDYGTEVPLHTPMNTVSMTTSIPTDHELETGCPRTHTDRSNIAVVIAGICLYHQYMHWLQGYDVHYAALAYNEIYIYLKKNI